MKYANKALRRATKNSDGVLDPTAERRAMVKYLTSAEFKEKLTSSMYVLNNLMCLSDSKFRELMDRVSTRSRIDMSNMKSLHSKLIQFGDISDEFVNNLNTSQRELVSSGKLADYLNEFLHGERKSYLSLSTPWQLLEEWTQFGDQSFDSSWELLIHSCKIGVGKS